MASARVLIVGSGFAGFFAARRLSRLLRHTQVEVTLLSETDGLTYAPLLPDVAVGALDPRAVVVPTAKTLRRVRVLRGHADSVDLDAATVRYTDLDGGVHTESYDRLLLTPGSVTRLLDIPGLAEKAIGLKTIGEALYLRDHVLTQFETAEAMTDADRRKAALTFLVVGAGYAGTELVAQMSRLTERLLPRYRNIGIGDVHWLLADVAHAVMPELGPELGADALTLLSERGVDVRLGVSIARVDGDRVTLTDDTELDCATVVWCAGVTANPLIAGLGLATEKGRLIVDTALTVPGHPHVFAIGDAAAVPDVTKPAKDGRHPVCPPTAQHAMRQATAAARNIAASLGHGTAKEYRHKDLGLVVDLGGPAAAATPLGQHLHGRLAKVVTRGYHLYALPTGNRRARVAMDWLLTAGSASDDVSFGLLPAESALITHAETHSEGRPS